MQMLQYIPELPVDLHPATVDTTLLVIGWVVDSKFKPREFPEIGRFPIIGWRHRADGVVPVLVPGFHETIARFQERHNAPVVVTAIKLGDDVFEWEDGKFNGTFYADIESFESGLGSMERGGLSEAKWKGAVKAFRSPEAVQEREMIKTRVVHLQSVEPAAEPQKTQTVDAPHPTEETPEEIAEAKAAMAKMKETGIVGAEDEVDASTLV